MRRIVYRSILPLALTNRSAPDATRSPAALDNTRGIKFITGCSAYVRALQSQISPHFLFNALNTLYGPFRGTLPMPAEWC